MRYQRLWRFAKPLTVRSAMILSYFKKDPARAAGEALYAAAAEQARAAPLYAKLGVADTLEGRFEMATLHVYLLLRRLKGAGPGAGAVSQSLVDALFRHLDDALREIGVGDLSIARKVRKLAENFYGRVGAYDAALASEAGSEPLRRALGRNVYENESAPDAALLADYVRAAVASLDAQPAGRLIVGEIRFPEIGTGR